MTLDPGTRLGVYEVLGPIGAGGMGEVYRARDTKLNRDVAIKVLPPAFASDPDRLTRFEREAQVLASLNHPNIAHIHGFEEWRDTGALIMELVDGDDLSAVIARGPMPLVEVVAIAKQIADALETAHEQGIIHRDLKPANIKVRADGTVKVLDFGLAKALDPAAASSPEAMNSPTLTVRATQMGVVIGTAAYMSPEQARGKAVDRRADIWAFGAVLFEMLSGQRAFSGEDISTTLASVLKDDVRWAALPTDLPVPMRRLLQRCLERDPKRRLRDIGEARLALEDPAASVIDKSPPIAAARASADPLWRRAIPFAVTAVAVGVLTGVMMWMLRPMPAPAGVTRFPIVLPDNQRFTRLNSVSLAVSPDGKHVAYIANRQLHVRSMAAVEPRVVAAAALDSAEPFFSPDSDWVGFTSIGDGTLYKVPIGGGPPLPLAKGYAYAPHWLGEQIVYTSPQGLMRVSSNGGEPETIVKTTGLESATQPQLLDGGRLVLFTLATEEGLSRWDSAQIVVQALDSGERHVIVRGGNAPRYVSPSPGGEGHLLYMVGSSLMAVPFDLKRFQARGSAVPVIDGVARSFIPPNPTVSHLAVSPTGTVAYLSESGAGDTPKQIAFAGRDGRIELLELPPQQYAHPRVSPDGRQLAVQLEDGNGSNIWVYDLVARDSPRRLTFSGRNRFPIWTRDGRFVTFQSDRDGASAVFRQAADGSGVAERLTTPGEMASHEPESWSPNDAILSMNVVTRGEQSVWTITPGAKAVLTVVADTPMVEKHSSFSPDGRWLAYMASGPGGQQVFVQPYPPTGAKYQISTAGGRTPVWSSDGKQLVFHSAQDNQLLAVDIRTDPSLSFGTPVALPIKNTFHPVNQRNYDVMPDGKRLVVVLPVEAAQGRRAAAEINIILNWFDELRARVAQK